MVVAKLNEIISIKGMSTILISSTELRNSEDRDDNFTLKATIWHSPFCAFTYISKVKETLLVFKTRMNPFSHHEMAESKGGLPYY